MGLSISYVDPNFSNHEDNVNDRDYIVLIIGRLKFTVISDKRSLAFPILTCKQRVTAKDRPNESTSGLK